MTGTMAMTNPSKRHPLLGRFTPAERKAGRYLRAPDHEADAGGGDAAEQATETTIETTEAEDTTLDTTALGGDIEAKDGDEAEATETTAEAPPEKYELTASEGVTLDAETLAEADPVFRELGLTNDGAQKLIPIAEKFAERITAQAAEATNAQILSEVTAQRKAWLAEAKADPVVGGNNWDQSLELAAKALDALGFPKGSPFRNFMTESGLGNSVHMITAFRKMGELVSEDGDFARGDTGAQIKQPREAILYPNDVPANT